MRSFRLFPLLALTAACLLAAPPFPSTPARADEKAEESQAGFPIEFRVAGRDVVLHEPMVLSYDFVTDATTLRFPATVVDAIGRKGFGAVEATATSRLDLRSRLARAEGIALTGAKFPSVAEADRTAVQEALAKEMPQRVLLRLELYTCRPGAPGPADAEPKFRSDPPVIHVRPRPAVLVQIDGKPQLLEVQTFPVQYVANSATDIFYKAAEKKWWMLLDGRWAESAALEGPWQWMQGRLPVELTQLRSAHARGHVRQFMPGTPEYFKRFGKEEREPAPVMPEVIL